MTRGEWGSRLVQLQWFCPSFFGTHRTSTRVHETAACVAGRNLQKSAYIYSGRLRCSSVLNLLYTTLLNVLYTTTRVHETAVCVASVDSQKSARYSLQHTACIWIYTRFVNWVANYRRTRGQEIAAWLACRDSQRVRSLLNLLHATTTTTGQFNTNSDYRTEWTRAACVTGIYSQRRHAHNHLVTYYQMNKRRCTIKWIYVYCALLYTMK